MIPVETRNASKIASVGCGLYGRPHARRNARLPGETRRRARGINLHRARSCIVTLFFPTTEMEIHMKRIVRTLAMLTLSAASLTGIAKVTEADMLGNAAQPSAAQRTIVIDDKTKWITVQHDEVLRFLSNGQAFARAFKRMSSSFDLTNIDPAGALDRALKVYVWPNARDLADKG